MKNRGIQWLQAALLSVLLAGCADATSNGKSRPIANAGSDLKIKTDSPIQLDGQKSYSPSGEDLRFDWNILTLSDGMADLRDGQTPTPILTVYQSSSCLVQLVVAAGTRESFPDTIQVVAEAPGPADDPAASPDSPPIDILPDSPPVTDPSLCQEGAPCDDGNPCSTHDSCQTGVCVGGAIDRDQDGDGTVDGACTGGTDCDDANALVHPGASEGPYLTASCRDGVDNNCDGKVDYLDPGCKPDAAQYRCKKRITIDHTKIAGTSALSGFPLYLTLTEKKLKVPDPGTCMQSASPNGLAFVNLAGEPLPHEIESYDAGTGALVAWVRLGAVSPTTDVQLYLLLGGPAQPLSPELPTQVWGTAHRAVWHLEENPADGKHADSTANHVDGTPAGNARDKGFEDVGFGQKLDGGNKQITIAHKDALNLGDRFALSMWVKWNDANPPQGYVKLISKKDTWNAASGFALATKQYDNTTLVVVGPGGFYFEVVGCAKDGWSAKTWHHLGVVFQGTSATVVCDGQPWAPVTMPSGIQNNTRPLTLGKLETETTGWKGLLDEVQLFAQPNPVEWIQTQFNNQADPAAFCTIVDE